MILQEIKDKFHHYFRDGQNRIQGEVKCFFKNGNIREIAYYKDGKREGEAKLFFENGNIQEIRYFKDGKVEGEAKWFFENGNIQAIKYYKDGIDITAKILAKKELLKEIEQL